MHEESGRFLQVEPFGCGVGCNQYPHPAVWIVENLLHPFALGIVHAAVEVHDAVRLVWPAVAQPGNQVVQRGHVFGKHDHPFVCLPSMACAQFFRDEIEQRFDAGVGGGMGVGRDFPRRIEPKPGQCAV